MPTHQKNNSTTCARLTIADLTHYTRLLYRQHPNTYIECFVGETGISSYHGICLELLLIPGVN